MKIVSVRQEPAYRDAAIGYFQQQWASPETMMLYEDAITRCMGAINPLPQWYLLFDEEIIVGCVGLITNDFISRMELFPWLCALFVDEQYRGQGCGTMLVKHVAQAAGELGFSHLHLCTDHQGYYEKLGFSFDGMGYHPWGESSRVYSLEL
ncbi:acetyltransferase (GNAT) family protein [Serratia fonticola]|uniref:Acetyltransferase (GNAT) family protein n=1 Tax=Serratia fonticola TaxID=47917 RepID=A0A542BTB9_SERFO|nr:GNAT family N-acetyltransferase [Serratia fonticola]TQI81814.1 acetyltransferase (GNAT) family protein [Serratia fonticola]TQI96163.1 acetyltransferase (GNAT) family protein [Serratia fonticola]TVZ70660.1 acetyltransferase (GNAT) family protein [Serratia fonticola]